MTAATLSEQFACWLDGTRILLVGGEREHATSWQVWLSDAGALVTTSKHTGQADTLLADQGALFDVFVVSLDESEHPGLAFARRLRTDQPGASILLIGSGAAPDLVDHVRAIGAAYLSCSASEADFMFTIARLLESQLPDLQLLVARAQKEWLLTSRQARILYYNLWSFSNDEIAGALGISVHTVQDYQQDLRRKTGARTKDGYLRLLLESAGKQAPPASKNGRSSLAIR